MSNITFPELTPEMFGRLRITVIDAEKTRIGVLVSLTVVGYEYLTTLADEVEFVWKRKWNTASWLFIFMRYWTFVTVIFGATYNLRVVENVSLCQNYLLTEGIFCAILPASADGVLALRVWALYGRSKKLMWFFLVLITAETVAMMVTTTQTLMQQNYFWQYGNYVHGCYSLASRLPPYFKTYALILLGVASLLFLMSLYRCLLAVIGHNRRDMPVVNMFLRDGILYFIVVLVLATAQTIVLVRGRISLAQVLIAPMIAVNGVASCRILMNMKRLGASTTVIDDSNDSSPWRSTYQQTSNRPYNKYKKKGGETTQLSTFAAASGDPEIDTMGTVEAYATKQDEG